ncbi:acyl-CoA dehydrogenase family protein [Streptomyces aidingensis]|uniref:Acyl-CoA dehydrogenase n=1 Tax=Streptomyces aidingensis TaxID=910347 RepID=A0A1I1MA69_9ACTN|nr:acyl-CoA dehydrogenase family protein [Streptomyces aidingensis]SFC79483.1 Acyl-CoA dehydrogenase [Streptomyces aidingensis]
MGDHTPSGDSADDRLDRIIDEVVAPAAEEVDRAGRFPRESVDALARAGVLGMTVGPDAGGQGAPVADAARVVERLAGACGSTAMVVLMHYAATAVLDAHGPGEIRRAVAKGAHLSTLAFSESGSGSHFWAPLSTAVALPGGRIRLDADKSWVTSAAEADSLVWSSRPLDPGTGGAMTLWLVPGDCPGLRAGAAFDGFGLRGNGSVPVTAREVTVPATARLGADGAGLDIALATALPCFLVLSAAFALGVMESLLTAAAGRLTGTRPAHPGRSQAGRSLTRDAFARLRLRADTTRAFLNDTLATLGEGRPDATLRVLQVKAVAAEAAAEVGDGVMRLCGGSAFRRGLGVERRFRDALASRVMAPTTEALYDFTARAALGLPLLPEPA